MEDGANNQYKMTFLLISTVGDLKAGLEIILFMKICENSDNELAN